MNNNLTSNEEGILKNLVSISLARYLKEKELLSRPPVLNSSKVRLSVIMAYMGNLESIIQKL